MAGRHGVARARWTFTIVLLGLTAVLAAGLGYQAWDASRSHEAVALSSVRGQAVFAATIFAREARGEVVFELMDEAIEVVEDAAERRGRAVGLTGDRLRASARSNRWGAFEHATLFFRLDGQTGELDRWGDPDPEVAAWARERSEALARGHPADDDVRVAIHAHRPEILVYERSGESRDGPSVHGVALRPEAFGEAFARAFRAERLLPEVLTGGLGNEEMFVARVVDPLGRTVYASAESGGDPEVAVRHPLSDELGGMEVELGVRPEALDLLVSGGLPESRLPFIVALLLLTSGLLGAAVWQLRREAELAELREDFVSSVSHELRTPLTQIRMFGEMLMLGRVRNDEERQRAVEIIVDEAARLTDRVENVLIFSRGERDALSLHVVETDLAELVTEVVEGFGPVAEAEGVTLRTRIDPEARCATDRDATRQAVLNILDNAVKYGPTGQVIEVGATRAADGGGATIWVEDEGPGIPAAQRSAIWEAYVRLDRDRISATAGSGIGLAVVRRVAEGLGGRVRVEPSRRNGGRGARFVMELPAPAAA